MTRGAYQYKPPLPFVPGMEAAGLIVETAPNIPDLTVGQRVMINTRAGLFATKPQLMRAWSYRRRTTFHSRKQRACW